MKCIILAAGKGTRLLPLTIETPKPLIKVDGVPIIDCIFRSLPDEITEVIIVVEHLKEKIKDYVGDSFYGRHVLYVDQIDMRGTFGALLSAKDLLLNDIDFGAEVGEGPGYGSKSSPRNNRFLVLNGDDIHDKTELEEYLKYPRAFGLQKMHMPNYHSVHFNDEGFITEFKPQTDQEKIEGALVATGAYLVDMDLFKASGAILRDGEVGLPQTILSQKDEYPSYAIITTKWMPINSFEDLDRAEKLFS